MTALAEPVAPAPDTTRPPALTHVGLALLCLLVGVTSLVSLAAGSPVGAAVLLGHLVVPGLLVVCVRPSTAGRYGLLVLPLGLGATVAVGTGALWLGWWHPVGGALLLSAGTVAVSATVLVRERGGLLDAARAFGVRGRSLVGGAALGGSALGRPALVLAGLLGVASGAWAGTVAGASAAHPRAGGLLPAVTWPFAVSMIAAIAVYALATRWRRRGWALTGAVMTLVVLRATGAAAASVPVYHWTYKHLGVVDLFQARGATVDGLDVYQAWPGFFAGAAWLSSASGVDAIDLARWTSPVLQLALALAVAALARALGANRDVALAAGLVAVVVNWVGQDYFAPQSVAIVLAATVLALVVDASASRAGLGLAIATYAVLVATHQLTPYWVLGAVVLVTLVRRRRWWVPVAMGAIAFGYLGLHYDAVAHYGIFSGFGNAVENARTTVAVQPSAQQRLDSAVARAAALLVWGSAAAVTGVRAWRRREGWLVPAVLAFSPFVLLLAQSYGGEAILRVMLFSVPGCAVVVAPVLVAALRGSGRWFAAAVVWLVLVAGVCAQATYDSWFLDRVEPAEIAVSSRLLDEVPGAAYLSSAVPRWPERATGAYAWRLQGQWDFDRSAYSEQAADLDFRTDADAVLLEDHLTSSAALPTYLVFSPAMDAYADYYGLYPEGTLGRMRAALEHRPGWEVIVRDGGVAVLRFVPVSAPPTFASRWEPR